MSPTLPADVSRVRFVVAVVAVDALVTVALLTGGSLRPTTLAALLVAGGGLLAMSFGRVRDHDWYGVGRLLWVGALLGLWWVPIGAVGVVQVTVAVGLVVGIVVELYIGGPSICG